MTPSARLAAAIEVLADVEAQRRPAGESLKDWGRGHRFAGSSDRAAIASVVYDALRHKASSAWIMGEDTPRASVLGALRQIGERSVDTIAALFSGEGHAPQALSEAERRCLREGSLDGAPAHVRGDYPEWLSASFAAAFGEQAERAGQALAGRAPLDLRVNTLKGDRDKAIKALAHLHPAPTPLSPLGLRLPLTEDGRGPALQAEPAYVKGLVEVQDEGSQIAALLVGATAGQQVLDLCAGGGGKSLALAAMMDNKGQIYASDRDGRRLMPIFERLERAGARNIQVRAPRGATDVLADLAGRCDGVLVDAPCTGTGAWRRNPDAKWRIRPGALDIRVKEQNESLADAARYVKPGGRITYVTCSVLREENEDRAHAFLAARPDFVLVEPAAGFPNLAAFVSPDRVGLRLGPHVTATDGFFVARFERRS